MLVALVVRGRFADRHVPRAVQDLLVAESGAGAGLGWVFLFLALYLIRFVGDAAVAGGGGGGGGGGWRVAMGFWFGETWGYTVLLGAVYGAVVGWAARTLLRWAEGHRLADRGSFLVPAVSLALFVAGTCGMLGTDEALACFVAGSVFAWDGWFGPDTRGDDSLQPTVDMLLSVPVFLWYGAVCPWPAFRSSSVLPLRRLVPLGLLVLLLRRLPWVFAVYRLVPQLEGMRQALFAGFFGPMGVSSIFYLYVALEFLHTLDVDGQPRADIEQLPETIHVVVWFIVVCSTVSGGARDP